MNRQAKNREAASQTLLGKFFREHSLRQLMVLGLEQWVQSFIGWIPGLTGFVARTAFYKLTFRQLNGMSYVTPGVTLQRSYGISAGKRLVVNKGTIIDGKGGVRMGDNVLIGPYVVIASTAHSYDAPEIPIVMQTEKKAEVVIGNDVWIGAHVVILPGIHIGDRVIIGAGAVVTQDIESHSVALGIPARKVRSLD